MSLGLGVGRTPTDEIDRTKRAFQVTSSSDILGLMMSRGFLPWVDGLGDGNLVDEIHRSRRPFRRTRLQIYWA